MRTKEQCEKDQHNDRQYGSWRKLLDAAVKIPGLLHGAYHAFHEFSLGNQVLAILQCAERGMPPGPINTYAGWRRLGRHVKKGQNLDTHFL